MTDLLAALTAEQPRKSRPCTLGDWIASRTPEEAAALRAAIAGHARTNRELAQIITDHGHPVSYSTIAVHRRGECSACRSQTT